MGLPRHSDSYVPWDAQVKIRAFITIVSLWLPCSLSWLKLSRNQEILSSNLEFGITPTLLAPAKRKTLTQFRVPSTVLFGQHSVFDVIKRMEITQKSRCMSSMKKSEDLPTLSHPHFLRAVLSEDCPLQVRLVLSTCLITHSLHAAHFAP